MLFQSKADTDEVEDTVKRFAAAFGTILVPGVLLVNSVQDMIKNHMTMGISRLGFAWAGCVWCGRAHPLPYVEKIILKGVPPTTPRGSRMAVANECR